MEGGPPRFRRDSSCPAVLRYLDHPLGICFAYGALTLSGGPFQAASATDSMRTGQTPSRPYNPGPEGPVWALPRSLAATGGISVDFSSSGYLDVSVPPVALRCLCIQQRITPHYRRWVSPFGDPRVNDCSASNRGLSQPSTSFFDSWCQGIRRKPFIS